MTLSTYRNKKTKEDPQKTIYYPTYLQDVWFNRTGYQGGGQVNVGYVSWVRVSCSEWWCSRACKSSDNGVLNIVVPGAGKKHQEPPCSIEIGQSPPQIIIDEGATKQATDTTPTEGVAQPWGQLWRAAIYLFKNEVS